MKVVNIFDNMRVWIYIILYMRIAQIWTFYEILFYLHHQKSTEMGNPPLTSPGEVEKCYI